MTLKRKRKATKCKAGLNERRNAQRNDVCMCDSVYVTSFASRVNNEDLKQYLFNAAEQQPPAAARGYPRGGIGFSKCGVTE